MRKRLTLLLGTVALVMAAAAPAAQADILTVNNEIEEPASEVGFPTGELTMAFGGGSWTCDEFGVFNAAVTANAADPVTLGSTEGVLHHEGGLDCRINGSNAPVRYTQVDVGATTLDPDGTGTMQLRLIEQFPSIVECEVQGTLQLDWSSGEETALSGFLVAKKLSGIGWCPEIRTVEGALAMPHDEFGAPAVMVVTP